MPNLNTIHYQFVIAAAFIAAHSTKELLERNDAAATAEMELLAWLSSMVVSTAEKLIE